MCTSAVTFDPVALFVSAECKNGSHNRWDVHLRHITTRLAHATDLDALGPFFLTLINLIRGFVGLIFATRPKGGLL